MDSADFAYVFKFNPRVILINNYFPDQGEIAVSL
jgi:hypothetical protein